MVQLSAASFLRRTILRKPDGQFDKVVHGGKGGMVVDENYECRPVQMKLGEDCETVYPLQFIPGQGPIVLAQSVS